MHFAYSGWQSCRWKQPAGREEHDRDKAVIADHRQLPVRLPRTNGLGDKAVNVEDNEAAERADRKAFQKAAGGLYSSYFGKSELERL
ncbi:hypothetical protein DPMN_180860 [Dreissena polymorpha]|uniref:Uncharacterized protein n=1 Tax=Dreissena polymorpha TaxID=45954 RepID=A0A9D4DE39_DREPO|nr:hypothetical protein DPMN_180860 [Dreissena polymorpha]